MVVASWVGLRGTGRVQKGMATVLVLASCMQQAAALQAHQLHRDAVAVAACALEQRGGPGQASFMLRVACPFSVIFLYDGGSAKLQ